MKLLPELIPADVETIGENALSLPQGIIGFGDYRRAELLYSSTHLPFLWMKLQGPRDTVNFVVIEPGGIVPGYELEIFDHDAESLDLTDASEAMILNIVTLRHQSPLDATVNLIGPILVNRRTRIGRQLVIANHSHYSARHLLVQNESPMVAATA
jgi:flagellar assembly factor FliW